MANKSLLFSPLQIGNVLLKNRIVISPMCQYSAEDGFANEWHFSHLAARAIGGAAVVMMEATGVEARGRITPHCTGIWKDEHIPPLKRITDFIKAQNSVPSIQLAHSGRKGSTYPPWIGRNETVPIEKGGWKTIGASPIAFDVQNDQIPVEATLEDIATIRQAFVDATKRSIAAGFEIIELHFAHGYLVSSFLSPHSNQRTDQYGGSFEGRTRLALEIVRDVKSVLPTGYPLFVRISVDEFAPNGDGWDLKQSIELSKQFKTLGVDVIDCSAGGNLYLPTFFIYNNVDQISMAEQIHKQADVATGAVGNIIDAHWAEQILQQNKSNLIFIGRISLDDPNWPLHAAVELNDAQHVIPNQYTWAIGYKTHGKWRQTSWVEKNKKQLQIKS